MALASCRRGNPNPENSVSVLQKNFSKFSSFVEHNWSKLHSPFEAGPELSLQNLANHVNQTLQSVFSHFLSPRRPTSTVPFPPMSSSYSSSASILAWASVSSAWPEYGRTAGPMSIETIEERLAGVPVYALSNSSEEFVLLSGLKTEKNLGLLCFKKEDADALLEQMKAMDPGMRDGSKVVAVALNKVFQLKVDGVAFRFIPDASEITNAIKEREKTGKSSKSFRGVPVFQSQSLILSSQKRRYRPVFFRKEDLERSLIRASNQQKHLNPAYKKGDIQVSVLEEIIKDMKESPASKWNDVVFIPPGFDVSTATPQ